jgi:hypothetical protein
MGSLCARSLRLPTLRAFQFSQLDLVNLDGFDTYIASTGCSTVTETAAMTTTTVASTTVTTTATGTTTVTATTITTVTDTSTAVTQTTTGSGCEGSGYGSSLVNQKGKNTFRIAVAAGLSLEECLDACTEAVNCAGVSYEVGLSFFLR